MAIPKDDILDRHVFEWYCNIITTCITGAFLRPSQRFSHAFSLAYNLHSLNANFGPFATTEKYHLSGRINRFSQRFNLKEKILCTNQHPHFSSCYQAHTKLGTPRVAYLKSQRKMGSCIKAPDTDILKYHERSNRDNSALTRIRRSAAAPSNHLHETRLIGLVSPNCLLRTIISGSCLKFPITVLLEFSFTLHSPLQDT